MKQASGLRRLRHIAAPLLLTCIVGAGTTFTLWRLQAETIANTYEIAALHARSFEDTLTHSLQIFDLLAGNALTDEAVRSSKQQNRHLAELTNGIPFLRSLSLLDEHGRIVASSNPANIGHDIDTADYLPAATHTAGILRLGTPWRGRDFADGTATTQLAPNSGSDTGFVPVLRTVQVGQRAYRLLAALNPDHFINHFVLKLTADSGSVEVVRYDGILLFATDEKLRPGTRHDELLPHINPDEQEFGSFAGKHQGAPSLAAYRASRLYPLLVVSHLDRAHALRRWEAEARHILAVVIPGLLIVLLFGFVLFRHERQLAARRAEADERMQLAASVFLHSREGIIITDAAARIIEVNDAFSRITGFNRDEVIGQNPRILKSGRQANEFYAAMWQTLTERGHWSGEIWNRRKNGDVFPELLTISAVCDPQKHAHNYVALFTDITQLKEHQRQLEHIAHYDALTGLPNRMLLADRLRQAMAQSRRHGKPLAVVYLDLDGFKAINDTHGHDMGDELLIAVAQRMKTALREGDTLARIGGDEFVAVLEHLDNQNEAEPILQRMLHAAAEPFAARGELLHVSASLGVTLFPDDGAEADQLMRHADQAMYQAKQSGKNRYHFFDIAHDSAIKTQSESLERIRRALELEEFVLYFQPKVNMKTGALVGAEALIRWRHPERGLLAPAEFLPIIENHALSADIDDWVLDTALAQMARWSQQGRSISVSINIGARLLQQGEFVAHLRERMARHPALPAGMLELEVLETSALEDMARIAAIMRDCQALGVHFSLDDFGTGYSSLTYLKRLPAALLKIDQSFVRDMLDDPEDLAIVDGVIGLATAFRRQVIAEGVESVEHGELLLPLGCELGQGYGIARPMPAEELPAWIDRWHPDPRWTAWQQREFRREDLPILFAEVDHRAWIRKVGLCLHDRSEPLPPMSEHECRFGRWYEGPGLKRHLSSPAFQEIAPLHRRIHALAVELIRMRDAGQGEEAIARFYELHALRDAMIATLHRLMNESC